MNERYRYLNQQAKKYLTKELEDRFLKQSVTEDLRIRCEKEIELLDERNLLFVIAYLYKYKKENQTVEYHFRGTINNLVLLFVLGIGSVNPIAYHLPYEFFHQNTIEVDIIHEPSFLFISYLEKQTEEIKIVHGFFVKEEIKEINDLLENHYLLLPCDACSSHLLLRFNEMSLLETVHDYRDYQEQYVTIRIDEKAEIHSNQVCLDHVLAGSFEKKIAKILKPKTIEDYSKIKSIARSADAWNGNQEMLVKEKKMDLKNLIASREDVLEYLLKHQIERTLAFKITHFIGTGKAQRNPEKWKTYVKVLQHSHCEEMFIDIFSKISFLFWRGEAVSECLYVCDETHYRKIEKQSKKEDENVKNIDILKKTYSN